ncbi:MAG: hypothetical protein IKO48_03770 [Elusimicrobia bacterium]|nr:hypothetical protein [Elusimicrobiota bacterium]
MEKSLFLLPSKKIISLILSVMTILNVFSVVLIYNAESIEESKNYTTDTIAKYCNIAVDIPMKLMSHFFKDDVSNSIGMLAPIKNSDNGNKKQEKDGLNDLFQYAVANDNISSVNFVKSLFFPVLLPFYNVEISKHNCNIDVIVLEILLFIILFNGSIMLARGDTEDIINNTNIERKVRLA